MSIAEAIEESVDRDWEDAGTWAAISGRWTNSGDSIRFDGPDEVTRATFPSGLYLNSKRLTDGEISVSVKLSRTEKTTAGVFFGFQSPKRSYVVAQIGAYDRAYSISQFQPDYGFISITDAGSIKNLFVDQEYELRVSFASQRVRMSVDDVEVLETILRGPLEGAGWGLFGWDEAPIEFTNAQLLRAKPKLFVIMPFKEPYNTLYREVIYQVARSKPLDFQVVRVDEIAGPGMILEDIRQQIDEAHVVVAEVSEHNANVFYELGYAHALNKPAILLARRHTGNQETRLPFDVSMFRTIFYDDTIGGKKAVEHELRRHLEAVLRDLR